MALFVVVLGNAPGLTRAQDCDFSEVDAALAGVVSNVPQLPGAGLRIGTAEVVLHEAYFGSYDESTVVRTASAAKLLSAAAMLSVVDDGLATLDQPVSTVLPQFTGLAADMNLRQMFSHTTGLPGGSSFPLLANDAITLAQAVTQIALTIPLEAAPATQFSYGGLSMHVGGRMVEVVDGRPWDDLFAARIAQPLGLTTVDYEAFGPTDNPRIAGGARTSLGDYAVFLEMLLNRGWNDGERVLSEAAVDEIFADQRGGLPAVIVPEGVGEGGYGLGLWRESFDENGAPIRLSDAGAFGFTPWIELDRRIYGIIMVEWLREPLLPALETIQGLVRDELDRCDARGESTVPSMTPAAMLVVALGLLGLGMSKLVSAGRSPRATRARCSVRATPTSRSARDGLAPW